MLGLLNKLNPDGGWDFLQWEDLPTMFFISWANDQNYAEHGGSIRCSWLTGTGEKLRNELAQLLEGIVE